MNTPQNYHIWRHDMSWILSFKSSSPPSENRKIKVFIFYEFISASFSCLSSWAEVDSQDGPCYSLKPFYSLFPFTHLVIHFFTHWLINNQLLHTILVPGLTAGKPFWCLSFLMTRMSWILHCWLLKHHPATSRRQISHKSMCLPPSSSQGANLESEEGGGLPGLHTLKPTCVLTSLLASASACA